MVQSAWGKFLHNFSLEHNKSGCVPHGGAQPLSDYVYMLICRTYTEAGWFTVITELMPLEVRVSVAVRVWPVVLA